MVVNDDIIKHAESWAASLWHAAQSRWSGRYGQDKSYRGHVIHPHVVSLLRESFPDGGIRILELGCGDGIFLDDRTGRELIADGGAYLGIDISAEFIEKASKNNTNGHIGFFQGNLADPALADHIISRGESWDCVLSIFVLQEIPNLKAVMDNLARIIPKGIWAVFVTVHPDFAEWLLMNGRMLKADDHINEPGAERIEKREIPWRWAAYYPIVDEPLDAFYLPYFHRSIGDYRSILENSGFVICKILEFPEQTHELPYLVENGISPFTPFENNLYWPRIGEAPSSIALLARKERERE